MTCSHSQEVASNEWKSKFENSNNALEESSDDARNLSLDLRNAGHSLSPPLKGGVSSDQNDNFASSENTLKKTPSLQPEESDSNSSQIEGKQQIAPQQMLRPRFQGMTQKEIIRIILEEENRPLKIADVAQKVYHCRTDDDFKRASASIAVALRDGVANKLWNKVPEKQVTLLVKISL